MILIFFSSLNLAVWKASEMKNWDVWEFTEKPSSTFFAGGVIPNHIPAIWQWKEYEMALSCAIFLLLQKNTSASRLESSWALFRCNFRTRDRSAHSPPRLCRWGPLPGDGDDSKGDNLILLLVYFHNMWVRATTWICWFHWRTWSEGIHCHLFGICVDPRTFVLSVTQTAPPGALLFCTPVFWLYPAMCYTLSST